MKVTTIFRKILLMCLGLLYTVQIFGQQDPQYTQYMYNPSVINPAYASSTDHAQFFGLYRAQWVGLEGAPKTAYISATMPLNASGLGMGVHVMNDRLGILDKNSFSLDLSYAIDLNYEYKLSFGLKGTGSFLNVNYDQLNVHNGTDPQVAANIKGKFGGNVGAGLFLYSERAYVGISAPALFSSDRYSENDIQVMKEKTQLYVMGGYVFTLKDNIQFKPAALVKAVSGAPLQVDVTANFMFYEKFTAGVAYRWDAALSGLVGFQVNKGLFIGYTYDQSTNKLSGYNSGSHEVFMRFALFNEVRSKVAPRFF